MRFEPGFLFLYIFWLSVERGHRIDDGFVVNLRDGFQIVIFCVSYYKHENTLFNTFRCR